MKLLLITDFKIEIENLVKSEIKTKANKETLDFSKEENAIEVEAEVVETKAEATEELVNREQKPLF